MAISLFAHASASESKGRSADMDMIVENLESKRPTDRMYAVQQLRIWVMQKSNQAQDFINGGHIDLLVECLRESSDPDTPSSSTTPDPTIPGTALLLELVREGRKSQDAVARCGGVPLLLELVPQDTSLCRDTELGRMAISALCLMSVGSEEARQQIVRSGGVPSLVKCLEANFPIYVRRQAAGVMIGLAAEKKDRQAAIIEANGLKPLIELLKLEADEESTDQQLAILYAATALRSLCDAAAATASFCRSGGLEAVVSRVVENDPVDRAALRLPMPLAPSTVRAECKQLLGDVYVSSTPVYQEKIVQILERHHITIDRITTTPTASEQTLEGRDSMEKGHRVLSCRTSVSSTKIPEIKLHLKKALRPKASKVPLNVTANAQGIPSKTARPSQRSQPVKSKSKGRWRCFFCACVSPQVVQ